MYPDKDAVEEKLKELEEIGDPDLVADLFRLYFEAIEDKKNQLKVALVEGKFDKIYAVAHALKSTCGNLGSQILFKKLVGLELITKGNTDLNTVPQVKAVLDDVLNEIDQFSAFINEKRQLLRA
jgi:HPt (histidine-containing phosphotransfer) domain-containing protein